ncbi:MAG: iron hydrogenase small subunit, partial [Firmicutes bacterium]|nr:iron hydrogenase small subunit [Bacillota bacterium]
DLLENLSTAKSPQQMFGTMSKTYMAERLGLDPDKIFSVSVMPCTAKKYERTVNDMQDSGHGNDVDLVLTTREVDRIIRSDGIEPDELYDMPFDRIFAEGSGAGEIFGSTGGVMEAALRSAYFLATGKNPDPEAFSQVRGTGGWREATFDLAGQELKIAIVSGLGNVRKMIEAIRSGKEVYDFVEVMACPGGCVGGGGQPFRDGEEKATERAGILYSLDNVNDIRFSHENPTVAELYKDFLGAPLSEMSHKYLHTEVKDWDLEMHFDQDALEDPRKTYLYD